MARNVYAAIMSAAKRGVGVRLTADECHALSLDDAISTAAANVDYEVGGYDGALRARFECARAQLKKQK